MQNRTQLIRFATLVAFFAVFEFVTLLAAKLGTPPQFDALTLVAFFFAVSLGGAAVAYLTIFEWLRYPFTKVVAHSSGAGEDVHPRTDRGPVIEVIGSWMCCPICAGAWVALGLYALWAFFPVHGHATIMILGVAGAGCILTRGRELLEWTRHEKQEQTGRLNRLNRAEQVPEHITVTVVGDAHNHKGFAAMDNAAWWSNVFSTEL